jgi:hypothetical protein
MRPPQPLQLLHRQLTNQRKPHRKVQKKRELQLLRLPWLQRRRSELDIYVLFIAIPVVVHEMILYLEFATSQQKFDYPCIALKWCNKRNSLLMQVVSFVLVP